MLLLLIVCSALVTSLYSLTPVNLLQDHTMVRRSAGRGGFTSQEMSDIVTQHNGLRSSEHSSDMMYMTWDRHLEDSAQSYASKCNFSHSLVTDRQNISNFDYLGENIYVDSGTSQITDFIKFWYGEKSEYNYDTQMCSGTCGHYTQIVWASTYAIGCGIQTCGSIAGTKYTNGTIVVCQYGPGGNIGLQRPFTEGPACFKCPANTFCKSGLCAFSSVTSLKGHNCCILLYMIASLACCFIYMTR